MTELTHTQALEVAFTLGKPLAAVSEALAAVGIETKRPPTNVERINELHAEWSSTSHISVGEYFAQRGVKAVGEEA